MTKVDELLAQAAALLEEANRLGGRPKDTFEDTFEDGDVVWFTHTFSTIHGEPGKGKTWLRPYVYVALKVNGRWYVTGRNRTATPAVPLGGYVIGWDELVEFADESSLWYVSEWTQLP